MLKVHTGSIEGTHLPTGAPITGQAIMVTSTKEIVSAMIVVSVDGMQTEHTIDADGNPRVEIIALHYKVEVHYPDMGAVGYALTDIQDIAEVENVQQRENRTAKLRKRKPVKFPRDMAYKSCPVLPIQPEPSTGAEDAPVQR